MNTKKKIKALSISTITLLTCALTTSIKDNNYEYIAPIKYADSNIESTQTSENVDSTLTSDSNSSSESTATDNNHNGIPDNVEEWWDNNIANYVFGISLGALISAAISILGITYQIVKYRSIAKQTKGIQEDSTNTVKAFVDDSNKIRKECADYALTNQQLLNDTLNRMDKSEQEQNKKLDELEAQIKANNELMKDYSQLSNRVDTILANQVILAQTDENTKNGNASKVINNSKEALNNGKE